MQKYINLCVFKWFLMGFKNKFLEDVFPDNVVQPDSRNKYFIIKSLCEIVGEFSTEYKKRGMYLLTKEIENGRFNMYNPVLIDLVLYGFSKEGGSSLRIIGGPISEERLDIINYALREIYKDNLDYVIAVVMAYHLVCKSEGKNLILNGPVAFFSKFLNALEREYDKSPVVWDRPSNKLEREELANKYGFIIIDPLLRFDRRDGYVLDLTELSYCQIK